MEADQDLRVELPDQGLEGHLEDVSRRRMRVRFPADAEALLPLGREFRVLVHAAGGGRSLETRGTITLRVEHESERSYGLELCEDLEQALLQHTCRRAARRVRPEPDAPVAVTVRPVGRTGGVIGELDDLSVLGLSVWIAEAAEAELGESTEVELRFRLPGCERSLRVVGHIRYRVLQATQVQLGVELDLARSRDPEQAEDALSHYVMMRQLDQRRQRAAR